MAAAAWGLSLCALTLALVGIGCTPNTLEQPPLLGNPSPRDAGPLDLSGFPDVGPMGVWVARVEPSHGPLEATKRWWCAARGSRRPRRSP